MTDPRPNYELISKFTINTLLSFTPPLPVSDAALKTGTFINTNFE